MPKIKKNLECSFLLPQIITGGVEKALLEILTEIKKQTNWKLHVYSLRPVTEQYFIEFFRNNNIKLQDRWFLQKPTNFFPKLIYKIINPLYRPIAKLLLIQSLQKSDVLIDFQIFSFAKFIRKCRAPKITWAHCSINYFNIDSDKRIKYLKNYDKMICLSDSFLEDFIEQYPDYINKVIRIYNPINAEEIQAKVEKNNNLGKYFLIVSRMDSEKDHETAISAFKMFAKTQPDAKLYIAGEGILKEKLERMAIDCPQIGFLGKIDEPYTLIKNCAGHILSSYNEGLPVTLMENAALGALSIASNSKSGIAEILMHGQAGILFTTGDKKQLAQILADVWNGKIETDVMIKTGLENIGRFSPKKNVGKIIDLIEAVFYAGAK